jgi:glycosyltransferase involved in cell wall biosynthesis
MLPGAAPHVLMGFYFSPRGGSAQVVRYLCRALLQTAWAPRLFAGSVGGPQDASNSEQFFSGIPCDAMDYTAAGADWARGGDAMSSCIPMHASYEDKADVPDRIFVDLDDDAYARQTDSWSTLFAMHAGTPDVVHLHHLTPMHEAVALRWPDVPVVTHLHGTELKMLAALQSGAIADQPGRCTGRWVARMQQWAHDSHRIIVVSEQDRALAIDLLPGDPARVCVVANGVDTDVFSPARMGRAERAALWKRLLVDDPRGWRPGRPEGSISYQESDLEAFVDECGRPVPVALFAGRFMGFKRVQHLIEAHHTMRSSTDHRAVLVIVGGFPGEWEGEHPFDTVQRLGAQDVFFVGWRGHDDLARILRCSDVFAAPGVDEPFGLVYLEAMAAGLPAIATNSGGPPTFINTLPGRPNGWLVPPDDLQATVAALVAAVAEPAERCARGRRAAAFVREHYSWTTAAQSFVDVYDDVTMTITT